MSKKEKSKKNIQKKPEIFFPSSKKKEKEKNYRKKISLNSMREIEYSFPSKNIRRKNNKKS